MPPTIITAIATTMPPSWQHLHDKINVQLYFAIQTKVLATIVFHISVASINCADLNVGATIVLQDAVFFM